MGKIRKFSIGAPPDRAAGSDQKEMQDQALQNPLQHKTYIFLRDRFTESKKANDNKPYEK
jgi:hypothetical protein